MAKRKKSKSELKECIEMCINIIQTEVDFVVTEIDQVEQEYTDGIKITRDSIGELEESLMQISQAHHDLVCNLKDAKRLAKDVQVTGKI